MKIDANDLESSRNRCESVTKGRVHKFEGGDYSFRQDRVIRFENHLERDFLRRTEFFLSVLDIIPDPLEEIYRLSELPQVPRFLVYFRLGNRAPENYVKPILVSITEEQDWRLQRRKYSRSEWTAITRYSKEQGWRFKMYDESRIRDQSLANITFLDQYKKKDFPLEESKAILETVRFKGQIPLHYILAMHFGGLYRGQGIAHIWHLIATRALDCDIARPLRNTTEIWVPTNE